MSEPSKLSFEESIQRLSKIVDQLEGGELPLEESLALFEEGIKLTRQSQARLDAAERRIEELLEVSDEGEPMTRPMSLRESLSRAVRRPCEAEEAGLSGALAGPVKRRRSMSLRDG